MRAHRQTERRQEIENRKQQRLQARKKKEKTISTKKRRQEGEAEGRAKKRHCTNPLQNLTEAAVQNSTKSTPNPAISLPKTAINKTPSSPPAAGAAGQANETFSLPLQSGRRARLPARFR